MDMKLYCIQVGSIAFRAPMPEVTIPMYCYLIEHPKGRVLVDTGMSIKWRDEYAVMEEDDTIVPQLARLGYTPDDIDYVVISHMHQDHAGNMDCFPNATFIIRREELRSAWWPVAGEGGYCYPNYEKTRDFKYIQPADDEDFDIFMDGRIILIDTRGHSRGHQSVVLDLPNTGKLVLAIDAVPGKATLDDGFSGRPSVDSWAAVQSIQKIKHLANCGYTVFYPHDPNHLHGKLAPLYYD